MAAVAEVVTEAVVEVAAEATAAATWGGAVADGGVALLWLLPSNCSCEDAHEWSWWQQWQGWQQK